MSDVVEMLRSFGMDEIADMVKDRLQERRSYCEAVVSAMEYLQQEDVDLNISSTIPWEVELFCGDIFISEPDLLAALLRACKAVEMGKNYDITDS